VEKPARIDYSRRLALFEASRQEVNDGVHLMGTENRRSASVYRLVPLGLVFLPISMYASTRDSEELSDQRKGSLGLMLLT
jgi:hypothetical protein